MLLMGECMWNPKAFQKLQVNVPMAKATSIAAYVKISRKVILIRQFVNIIL